MSNIKEAIELLENFRACGRYAGNIFKVDQALAKLSTEQPPDSEFTKDCRSVLDIPPDGSETDEVYVTGLAALLRLACARLDRSEESRKELLTACRQAFNESRNPKVEKILKAAIAKEKEVKK